MLIDPYAFFFGLAIARNRGLPANTATSDAFVASVIRPRVLGIILVSALARSQRPTPTGGVVVAVSPQLTAAAVSSSQINLFWTAPIGAETYNLSRGTKSSSEGGKKKQIAGDLTDLSYSDSSLDADKTYFYSVDAFDADGNLIGTSNEASDATDSSD